MCFDFKKFFLDLPKDRREEYAKNAGTTAYYIHTHLINRYKTPRRLLMQGLANASNGAFNVSDLSGFFYSQGEAV
uniref:hypothetical protein n=1 Tax=Crenothrix polyspora TaxID=360316 RepID=UPI000B3607B1|nr:hypothetical protein [Crenothrix polyspora]